MVLLSNLQFKWRGFIKPTLRTLLLLGSITLLSIMNLATAQNTNQTILVVGDSLSAEYGLKQGSGWVALMQNELSKTNHTNIKVINASISGDTTAGGRARLGAALTQHKPTIIILELGANDALRGLSLKSSKDNLQAMITMSKGSGAKVLLLGIQVPPNYGRAYTEQFAQMFIELAQENKIALIPFFLAGIADAPNPEDYFQQDRTHPNESAHPIILNNIWPELKKLLNI